MSGIRIKSFTEIGDEAIKRHIEDKKKESLKNRLLYKQMFKERYYEDKGRSVLELHHKHKRIAALMGFEAMKAPIIDTMTTNGAEEYIDYEVKPL